MKKLKIFELFAGIGAPRKALIDLGIPYESMGYSEINKFAVDSYSKLYDDTNNFGDITKINELPNDLDLLFHGSPCQDFSQNGKQLGLEGKRSILFMETLRLVKDALPKVVIWENVKGLLGPKHKSAFDMYINTMESMGYVNHYKVLNARHYGVPQNRERIFVVSILNNHIDFRFPLPLINLDIKLKDMLDIEYDKKHILMDPKDKTIPRSFTYTNQSNKSAIIARVDGRSFDTSAFICDKNKYCGTLTTMTNGRVIEFDSFYSKEVVRKLSPKEYWRLMGFKDSDFEKITVSDTQKYKQAGNSIVVDVIKHIFMELYSIEKIHIG